MLKHYWFLILLLITAFYRIDFTCFSKECPIEEGQAYSFVEYPIFVFIREHCIKHIESYFPSPHSELLLGMTVGLDKLSNVPSFKEGLKRTGTIHVVVVSGFNISLVFNTIVKLLGSGYKLRNLVIAQILTGIYSVLTGFEPPVVRALIMGSIISWGKYYGRSSDTLLVLVTSGLIMVVIQPLYFFNLSFLLSFTATLGLILFSTHIARLFKYEFVLIEDFVAGLSAQLLVWPIISYFFGTVSLISLLVNTIILWTVPFTTILGTLFLIVSFISRFISSLFLIPLYILLNVFVQIVLLVDSFRIGYFDFKLSLFQLLTYYLIVLVAWLLLRKRNKNHDN